MGIIALVGGAGLWLVQDREGTGHQSPMDRPVLSRNGQAVSPRPDTFRMSEGDLQRGESSVVRIPPVADVPLPSRPQCLVNVKVITESDLRPCEDADVVATWLNASGVQQEQRFSKVAATAMGGQLGEYSACLPITTLVVSAASETCGKSGALTLHSSDMASTLNVTLLMWLPATVRCAVIDHNGTPITGATVVVDFGRFPAQSLGATPPRVAPVASDERGIATVEVWAASWATFYAEYKGAVSLPVSCALEAGVDQDLSLQMPGLYSIRGTVEVLDVSQDSSTANASSQCIITTIGENQHTPILSAVDASAQFDIALANAGRYVLSARCGALMSLRPIEVILSPDRPNASVALRLEPGAVISGRIVRDNGSGVPLAMVRGTIVGIDQSDKLARFASQLFAKIAISDWAGNFRLGGLASDSFYDVECGGQVIRAVRAGTSELAITVLSDVVISGHVRDKSSKAPIHEFIMSVRGLGSVPETLVKSDDGSFMLRDIPDGTSVVIDCRAEGYSDGAVGPLEVHGNVTDIVVELSTTE